MLIKFTRYDKSKFTHNIKENGALKWQRIPYTDKNKGIDDKTSKIQNKRPSILSTNRGNREESRRENRKIEGQALLHSEGQALLHSKKTASNLCKISAGQTQFERHFFGTVSGLHPY